MTVTKLTFHTYLVIITCFSCNDMGDFNQTKFRSTRREDPRLAKADAAASSSGTTSELQKTNWPDQNLQYNTSLQTTYQHLQPPIYGDVSNILFHQHIIMKVTLILIKF